MKNYTNKNKRNKKLIAIILLLVFAGLVWALATYLPTSDKEESKEKPTNNNGSQQVDDEKDKPDEEAPKNEDTGDGKTPVQNEGKDPNKLENITGFVTNKSVNADQKTLTIRVTIDQFISQAGTCTLSLTHATSGKVVTKTAPTFDNPSSSTCQGFDVPLSELSSGNWRINIKVKSQDKLGEISGGEVAI